MSAIPGMSRIDLSVRTKFTVTPTQAAAAPGGLYPWRAAAYQMDEYRLMAGWPVAVPEYDIRVSTLCSAEGEVLSSRESPTSLTTNALARWVADEQFIDTDALRWSPITGSANWESSVEWMPEFITDYEYRVGDERFVDMNALNFDSDTQNHMWINLGQLIHGAGGYTVIMVLSPNSVYGNDTEVPYNGIWCYGAATPDVQPFTETTEEGWANFTMQGNYLWMETESQARQRGIAVGDQLRGNAPSYIALVVNRPQSALYVGTGPSNIRMKALPAGAEVVALDDSVVLGRSTGDIDHTADMALFDLGLYADALTATQVRDEFAQLSRVYGGDT